MTSIITEKRLKHELKDLRKNKLDFAQAIQDETNKFIFYFLLKGDKESSYEGGYYIGKIMLPKEYPDKPGDFMMLTPNGRFMTNHKICLTNSGYHTDTWMPTWSIRNMIIGFASIFNSDVEHGISHIRESPEARKKYAKESIKFNLENHKNIFTRFTQFIKEDGSIITDDELEKIKTEKKLKKEKKKSKKHRKEDKENDEEKKETDDKKETDENKEEEGEKEENISKNKTDIIKEHLEKIKNMTFEEFDEKIFREIYDIMCQ